MLKVSLFPSHASVPTAKETLAIGILRKKIAAAPPVLSDLVCPFYFGFIGTGSSWTRNFWRGFLPFGWPWLLSRHE